MTALRLPGFDALRARFGARASRSDAAAEAG